MYGAENVTATFSPNQEPLSVNVSGSGTVTGSGVSISGPGSGSYNLSYGTPVTLTATPTTGYQFAGWSGACSGTGTCVLTMNGAESVTATFSLIQETLSVSVSGSGTVTGAGVSGPGSYHLSYGTVVTLTATPSTGYLFTGWSGACSGTGTCALTMNSAENVTATFSPIQETFSVSVSGCGTVTGAGVSGPGSYHLSYGTEVTLTATPCAGYQFTGWSGVCSGTGTCTLTVNGAETVQANFSAPSINLTASSNLVSPGTPVTLTATVQENGIAVHPGLVNFCNASVSNCLPGGGLISTVSLTSSGTATLRYRFGLGPHSVNAQFVGTSSYPAVKSAPQTINVALSPLASTGTQIWAGGPSGNHTFFATVWNSFAFAPTGTVTFVDTSNNNSILGTATLEAPTTGLAYPAALSFSETSYAVGNSPYAVAVGDFNGDGIPDIAVANAGGNTVSILLGDSNGTFQAAVSYAVGTNPHSVAVGDFNGDGNLDLAVANEAGNTVSILLGKGDGTFQSAVNYTVGTNPYSVAVGDFNGDGILDLAVANEGSNTVSILLGNGNGTFQPAVNYPVGTNPYAVVAGDFNNDGKPDLAVANEGSGTVGILLGNGNGTFNTQVTYAASGANAIAIGDFNGDGNLDLAVTGSNQIYALLNNGDGTFGAATVIASGQPFAGADGVAVADFNGDGIPDVVAVMAQGDSNILLGNGDGTFQDTGLGPRVSAAVPESVAVADFNGDGLPDVAVVGMSSVVQIDLNQSILNGSATATLSNVALPSGTQYIQANYSGDSDDSSSQSSTVKVTGP